MAIVYMMVILFDFIIAPIFWSAIQMYTGLPVLQWAPLTLQGGGLFHAAMGAVIGISAFSRGQEKIEKIKSQLQESDSNSPAN